VWAAHLDADAHYNTAGWREGRDPSAFFSTSFYLAQNADVRAAGVNPLQHYDASGWREGRSPSAAFDPAHYLSAAVNPDVLAAGVAPLRHYFEYGYQEGRVPLGPDRLLAPDGFDYVYYLAVNPDVAAAGVDPLLQPGRLAGGARSVGAFRHRRLSRRLCGRRGRGRQPAAALPPLRHRRGPLRIRRRRLRLAQVARRANLVCPPCGAARHRLSSRRAPRLTPQRRAMT
jgi:hypothetical protein